MFMPEIVKPFVGEHALPFRAAHAAVETFAIEIFNRVLVLVAIVFFFFEMTKFENLEKYLNFSK